MKLDISKIGSDFMIKTSMFNLPWIHNNLLLVHTCSLIIFFSKLDPYNSWSDAIGSKKGNTVYSSWNNKYKVGETLPIILYDFS